MQSTRMDVVCGADSIVVGLVKETDSDLGKEMLRPMSAFASA